MNKHVKAVLTIEINLKKKFTQVNNLLVKNHSI